MALLDLVCRIAPEHGWKIVVAHLDHAQRPESAEEAEFVARRCRELGVKLVRGKLSSKKGKRKVEGEAEGAGAGGEGEEYLRAERHKFFKKAMTRTKSDVLLLAHQADDRAETFLMRLLAGSGPTGLASIRPVERIEGMKVIRPLLGIRRGDLRDYLRTRGLGWRDDPTNDDERGKRSWVRGKVMPLFNERMGLDVTPRIARAAELIGEEAGALDEAVSLMLASVVRPASSPSAGRFSLRHPYWRMAQKALRRLLLRRWLWNLRGSPHPPGFGAVEEALKFALRSAEGVELRTVGRMHLVKRGGWLTAFPAKAGPIKRARYFG
ncbi:tRNA lysidine(34) synthetase TilS [Candidatus Sumerlaeota bacterium]|nr:tRNA lysidine(34) synthetase TilS [Candidatus Sumerlaeota bacterium]